MKPQVSSRVVRIANAQGFWGDDDGAAARLVSQQSDLDYLTLDYLAEVSMSILAMQRQKDPSAGYARDFVGVIESLAPFWARGATFKLITNAGGLNPMACAQACSKVLKGVASRRIAIVSGDDVLPMIHDSPQQSFFAHMETRQSIEAVLDKLITANAYLGAEPLVDALNQGAELVITGRVADPSLTVAAAASEHGWSMDEYRRLAGATVAGHLIECGTQVTGGICTDWLDIPDPAHIGFPIVAVEENGDCTVTKPLYTGGLVNEQTVKEQLLYELGDPAHYLSPDCTVSFLTLSVTQAATDHVRVSNATGGPPPDSYKVSATYKAGYRAAGTLTIFGPQADRKAHRCGAIIRSKLHDLGCDPQRYHSEWLGGTECGVLRIAVADQDKTKIDRFSKELMPLVTAGPQGITGYAEGRPKVREIIGYWPCLIPRKLVQPQVTFLSP